jgi:AAA+ ATPase superfamily predicted ATPase
MLGRDYFPLGVASGAAFCNRIQETKILVDNISHCRHSLLSASRRFGKSSLALHAIEASKIPFVEIDFYMARNEKIIAQYILKGVITLIGKSIGNIDKFMAIIKQFVSTLKPKFFIENNHFNLELTINEDCDPATSVQEALQLLEHLLARKRKKAILLLDEFQNVGAIAKGSGIEGAIRHVIQKTKHLTCIFSGSNRKLLETIFNDNTRPLYKLCWKITLKRISVKDYIQHIQKAANITWSNQLSINAIEVILKLTQRHPYYVNKLCDKLWTICTKPPAEKDVHLIWQTILREEKSEAVKDILLLSAPQKAVLLMIAQNKTTLLTSKNTLLKLQMTSSAVIAALEALIVKDIIEKENANYQIINPIIKYYVNSNSP